MPKSKETAEKNVLFYKFAVPRGIPTSTITTFPGARLDRDNQILRLNKANSSNIYTIQKGMPDYPDTNEFLFDDYTLRIEANHKTKAPKGSKMILMNPRTRITDGIRSLLLNNVEEDLGLRLGKDIEKITRIIQTYDFPHEERRTSMKEIVGKDFQMPQVVFRYDPRSQGF